MPVERNTVLSSMSVKNGIIVITQGKKWMTMNSVLPVHSWEEVHALPMVLGTP